MALVTIHRPSSPQRKQDVDSVDSDQQSSRQGKKSQGSLKKLMATVNTIKFVNRLRFSESYFTIKGAALILSKPKKFPPAKRQRTKSKSSIQVSGIQTHLQCMFNVLRADDTIQIAIQLDSLTHYSKYLAIVVTNSDTGECQQGTIIGFHCSDEEAFIGLVLPIYRNTSVVLDGDGGFQISTEERYYVFKPTGVQAMWSAWMAFTKVCSVAQENNHRKCGSTHTWLSHYTDRITQQQSLVNEWNELDDLMSRRQDSYAMNREDDSDSLKRELRIHLREILIHSDLEELTSIRLRTQLEGRVGQPLKQYRRFIDEEMMLMIRQLDVASQIFDFVYLGTEWNASNLKDLQTCGIGYILNVTKEIDNFFPGLFKYKNIRLYDEEHVNLMKHWEHTHKFICDARDNNSKVLVHCKMGISRSASTVIAFAMKEYGWSLDYTLELVKSKRPVICPNDGFMQQLHTYEGILNASKQRWNSVFSGEEDKGMSRDTLLQKNESDLFSSTSSASAAAADSQTDTTLDEACTGMAAPTHTIENNSSTSDSESTDSDAGSTVGSQLEEDAVFTSSGSPDNEPGVSNSQPCSDIISPEQAAPRDPLFSTHTTCSNPAGEEFSGLSPSNHLQTSLNISAETETEVANDVSVCSGVVQKTKHQIIGLSQNQTAVTKQGEPVPVTPGTVRKVLGKIEQQCPLENTSLGRSDSFKLRKPQTDSLYKSAPAWSKADDSPSLEKGSKDCELIDDFPESQHRGNLEKPVKFSIGEESLSGEITPAESSEVRPSISSPESSNAVTSHEQTTSKQTECILKVASKPMLIAGGSPTSPTVANSPVPVKALVGAFECIGSAKELNRPLTVHVDSFNSDPFTKKASTASISPLQRSQSLKALSSQNKADDNSGGSRNYTTQKQPQLHMKMKRDTLQHSISTTVIRTDNLS